MTEKNDVKTTAVIKYDPSKVDLKRFYRLAMKMKVDPIDFYVGQMKKLFAYGLSECICCQWGRSCGIKTVSTNAIMDVYREVQMTWARKSHRCDGCRVKLIIETVAQCLSEETIMDMLHKDAEIRRQNDAICKSLKNQIESDEKRRAFQNHLVSDLFNKAMKLLSEGEDIDKKTRKEFTNSVFRIGSEFGYEWKV